MNKHADWLGVKSGTKCSFKCVSDTGVQVQAAALIKGDTGGAELGSYWLAGRPESTCLSSAGRPTSLAIGRLGEALQG